MAKSSDAAKVNEPSDEQPEEPPKSDDAVAAEQELVAQTQAHRQEVPFTPADTRDPQEWTEPGWQQGLFPGDPNKYDDPDNPTKSY